MLLLFLALVVLVVMLIRRERRTKDRKGQALPTEVVERRLRARMWWVALLSLVAGLSLGLTPVLGPPATGGLSKATELLISPTPALPRPRIDVQVTPPTTAKACDTSAERAHNPACKATPANR